MKRNKVLIAISIVIFLSLFFTGLLLAKHKPLWGDELFGQIHSISRNSYANIFSFKISEGNICPLFYFLQKLICDAARYKLPQQWSWQNPNLDYNYKDSFSQVFLRINPVFFVSLGITLIFYFFSRHYSIFAGAYSLIVSLLTSTVWAYWAETRVYALWFFLTTTQFLLFLYLIQENKNSGWAWKSLVAVHFLLSMSIVFSIAQIAIVSLVLWIFLERNWKRYIILTLMPSLLCVVYYINSPKYNFLLDVAPSQLVRSSFPNERLAVLVIFTVFLFIYFIQKKSGFLRIFEDNYLIKGRPAFLLSIIMICSAYLLLFIFKLLEDRAVPAYSISNRYFVYLAPIGIITVTLLSVVLFRSFKKRPSVQLMLVFFLGGLLIMRAQLLHKTVITMFR